MNKKGVVEVIFAGLFVLMIVAAVISRPAHTIKRCTEKCVAGGDIEDVCKNSCGNLSLEERIEYIRDI